MASITYVELALYGPLGKILLPDFVSANFDVKYNDLGSIEFTYPLDKAKSLGITDQAVVSASVGFSDGTSAEVERYVIEGTGDEKVIDGMRLKSLTGRSSLAMLYDAVVYPSNWPVTAPTGHNFTDQTVGNIMKTLILRAQARGALTTISTSTFSGTQDSFSAVWSHQHTQDYATGTAYYEVLKEFMDRGYVDAWLDSSMELRLVNGGTRGAHVGIGSVEVRPAHNVSEMTTTTNSEESVSTVLIEGEEGTAVERHNAAVQTLLGRRRERYVQQGGIMDAGVLNLLGDAELELYGRIQSEEIVGITNTGILPFKDFQIADWVWVRYESDQNPVERRVWQLAVDVDENGELSLGVTLNSILYESDVALARKVEAYAGSGGSYGSTPNTSPDNTVPEKPVSLGVTSGTFIDNAGQYQGAFSATWVAPTTNVGGSPISDLSFYEVQFRYTDQTSWSPTMRTAGEETLFGFSPVTPGREIEVRVRTVDETGHRSAWAGPVTHVLDQDLTGPPTPSAPDAEDGPAYIKITWDGFTDISGAMPPDFSHVEVWESTSPTFADGGSRVGQMFAAGTIGVPGGDDNQTMYYRLRAVDRAKNLSTSYSAIDSAKRLPVTVDEPTDPPESSPDIEVTPGIGVFHVRWEPLLSGSALDYDIHCSSIPDFSHGPTSFVATTPGTVASVKSLRQNKMLNGDFSTTVVGSPEELVGAGDPYYTIPEGGTLVRETEVSFSGDYVAKFTPATPTGPDDYRYFRSNQQIPVTEGHTYTVSARARSGADNGQIAAYIYVRWYDANGDQFEMYGTGTKVGTNTWATTSGTFEAPVGAVTASMSVHVWMVDGSTFCYVDQLEFVDADSTESLSYDTDYYFLLVARNGDLEGPPSSIVGPYRLKRADNEEISADYLYAGKINANQIVASELVADIGVLGRLRTAAEGQRVELSSAGIRQFGPDGESVRVNIPSDPAQQVKMTGSFQAEDITVTDGMELRGRSNIFSIGSKVTLQTQVVGSAAPPVLSNDYSLSSYSKNQFLAPLTGLHLESAESGATASGTTRFFTDSRIFDGSTSYQFPLIDSASGPKQASFEPSNSIRCFIQDTNLMTDPFFESNSTGWISGGNASVARDSAVKRTGSWSLKITNAGSNVTYNRAYYRNGHAFPSGSGTRYYNYAAGAWVRNNFSVPVYVLIRPEPFRATNAVASGQNVGMTYFPYVRVVPGQWVWVESSRNLVTGDTSSFSADSATHVGLYVDVAMQPGHDAFDTPLPNGGVVYIDDVVLKRGDRVVNRYGYSGTIEYPVTVVRGLANEPGVDSTNAGHEIRVYETSALTTDGPIDVVNPWYISDFNWYHTGRVGRVFSSSASTGRSRFCHVRHNSGSKVFDVLEVWDISSGEPERIFKRNSLPATFWKESETFLGVTYGSSTKLGYTGTDENIWIIHGSENNYVFKDAATLVRQPNREWPTRPNSTRTIAAGDVQTNSFVRFIAVPTGAEGDAGYIFRYSHVNWEDAGGTKKFHVVFTWAGADGTPYESGMSGIASINMRKRANLNITVPPLPDPNAGKGQPRQPDDVNRFHAYYVAQESLPDRTDFVNKFDNIPALTTNVAFTSLTVGWTTGTPPANTNFPSQIPATIESNAPGTGGVPKIKLGGDGEAHFEALDVGGDGALSLTGKAFNQLYYSIRAQSQVTGGGIKSANASGALAWDQRFITISIGRDPDLAASGYFSIEMPPNGTVIPGYGGAPNVTVTSGRIATTNWQALWYELPYGETSVSKPDNFRLTYYGSDFVVPNNWVLLAVHNADTSPSRIEFATGEMVDFGYDSDSPVFKQAIFTATADASTAGGNKPALRVGNINGQHLRIDGNEIIAMSGNTGQGTLYLNQSGPVSFGSGAVSFGSGSVNLGSGTTTVPGTLNVSGNFNYSGFGSLSSGSANTFMNTNGTLYRISSSKRFKENIRDFDVDADRLLDLRPVKFHSTLPDDDPDQEMLGFIAEEADELGLTDWVEYDDEGKPLSFFYSHWVVALQKIVRAQQERILALETRIGKG